MAASLPSGRAISRTACRAAAARRAGGASLTSPGPKARIHHEVQGGVASDDATDSVRSSTVAPSENGADHRGDGLLADCGRARALPVSQRSLDRGCGVRSPPKCVWLDLCCQRGHAASAWRVVDFDRLSTYAAWRCASGAALRLVAGGCSIRVVRSVLALGARLRFEPAPPCIPRPFPVFTRPFGTAWPKGMPGRFINTT